MSSIRPTEAASPSWTQSMEATAIEVPVRAGERVMASSEGDDNRSRPREFGGQFVHRISTMHGMDVRRLRMLLELSRLGSMHEVADALGTTTSSVSQGIAALAREVGTPLVEPDGRRVRLTPAGRRLAEHAVTILAAVESARLDLDPGAEPVGRAPRGRASPRRSGPRSCRRSTTSAPTHPGDRRTHPGARAARGLRPPRPRRGRPGPRLRLRPRARRVARRPRGHAAVDARVGSRACRRATAGWRWPTSPTATGS